MYWGMGSYRFHDYRDTFGLWSELESYNMNPIYLSGGEYPPKDQTKLRLRKKRKSKSQRRARRAQR